MPNLQHYGFFQALKVQARYKRGAVSPRTGEAPAPRLFVLHLPGKGCKFAALDWCDMTREKHLQIVCQSVGFPLGE